MQLGRGVVATVIGMCIGFGTAAGGAAQAQEKYPARPIKIIVPFAAGGSTDVIGRAIAQKLSERVGQPVIVENVAGASTMIGAERASRAEPDGYTLLVASSTTFSTNPHLFKRLSTTIDDFVGVSLIAESPLVLATTIKAPFNDLKELAAYAKAHPDHVAYGTTGRGGISHLVGEMTESALGIKMIDVPYKGSAPALADVIGGQLPMHVDSAATSLPLLNSGRIKILAITTEKRAEAAPAVPTFAESGYPDMVVATLIGLFAPAKTPQPIVEKLNAAMKAVLADQELLNRFKPEATVPHWTSPEECVAMFKADRDRFGKVMQALDIEKQ